MSAHTLSVLVENRPGVLARVAGLFARRGFNIESLAVGETDDPSISRMTIVVSADGKPLEQIIKQLYKLINVLRIAELAPDATVARELALIKVVCDGRRREDILRIAEIFRARVCDVDTTSLVIEATGAPDKIAALEELLQPYGIVEMVRTGRVALSRGAGGLGAPKLEPVEVARAS